MPSPRETFLICVICLLAGGFLVHMRTNTNTTIVEELPSMESSEEQLREEKLSEAQRHRAQEPCPVPDPCPDPAPCPAPVQCPANTLCPAPSPCPVPEPCPAKSGEKPKYLCPNAFVDLGSNRGDSIEKFLEPSKHQGGLAAFFQDQKWNPAQFCIFGFEGNPVFNKTLEKLQTESASKVVHIEIFTQTLAHEKDGTISFYLDTVNTGQNFWGSSILPHHPDVIKSGGPQKVEVKARAINIGAFLQKRVDPAGVMVVKMDIEGGEYGVLADLLSTGRMCFKDDSGNMLFDHLVLEYHAWTPSEGSGGQPFPTVEQYSSTVNWMIAACGVKLRYGTD